MAGPQKLEAVFYKSQSGAEPVRDWLKRLPKDERKRLQVEHAPSRSLQAKQLKLADKISNVRDIMGSPPVAWPVERCQEYLDWALQVVDGLRGANPALEAEFDRLYGS